MANKTQILAQLEALRIQLATCDCSDELAVFNPDRSERFYTVTQDKNYGYFGSDSAVNHNGEVKNAFRSSKAAIAYGKAFQTLLALRTQSGAVPVVHGECQYLIEACLDGSRLEVRKRTDAGVKQSRCFSPAFKDESSARSAINTVGADNIIQAMKTLSGV